MYCRIVGLVTCTSTLAAIGCSPAGMAVKIGTHLVGVAIANEEVDRLSQQLLGKPPSAADDMLGQRVNTWDDLRDSRRQWITYAVKLDVLDRQRYVIECVNNRIVAVELFQKSDSDVDIPLELVYYAKVQGKGPREAEAALGLGAPLAEGKSRTTGEMFQIYDGRLIKELQSPHNCVLHFDAAGRCTKVNMVQVPAATR